MAVYLDPWSSPRLERGCVRRITPDPVSAGVLEVEVSRRPETTSRPARHEGRDRDAEGAAPAKIKATKARVWTRAAMPRGPHPPIPTSTRRRRQHHAADEGTERGRTPAQTFTSANDTPGAAPAIPLPDNTLIR